MSTIARGWLPAVFLLLAVPMATPAHSQSVDLERALARFTAANPGTWRVEWSAAGDQAVSLRGRSADSAGDPAEIATRFIAANADVLGLAGGVQDLKLVFRRRGHGDTHLSYQQTYAGLPVFNGFVDVHLNDQGEVYLVHNSALPGATKRALSLRPGLTTALAATFVRDLPNTFSDKRGLALLLPAPSLGVPELGIQRTPAGARLAYRIDADAKRYVIDANTGALLDTIILMQSVDGTGKVFDPNPVDTLNDPSLFDHNNKNYPALEPAYFDRTLQEITETNAHYRLVGPYVKTLDLKASSVGSCMNSVTEVRLPPPVQQSTSFVFNRSRPDFEHTNVYFHLDTSERYIQARGFDDLWNAPIRVDAHGITIDNSFYCSVPVGAGYIAYGDGGVDDSEDADVVLHEYGHALQDAASNGRYSGGGETGAMGEGFGDYWGFSGQPSGPWAACFGEWDRRNGCWRRLDKNKHYPEDIVHEVHADGEIWSRGLRDLLLDIGKIEADTIILESHFLVPNHPKFSDGLTALLDADDTIYSGANHDSICTAFAARGITAPGCT